MLCPACNHDQDRVVDSRATREGAAIRRRRECLGCGHRFTTYEYVERAPVLVAKKDGRRVPYDREKLLDGVISACQKRPVSREQIDSLAARVEARIFSGVRDEVESQEIGEAVMDELEELDEVAYVRFASVYRSFRNVNQFMHELRSLLERHPGDGPREGSGD
ncbi:transcriptional regulator NrdR [bacterium]|nr:MAG: transcriptional regulator NrdR [bacterium]